jgi:hypothetical protein
MPTRPDAIKTAVGEVDCESANGFELPHDEAWWWHFVKNLLKDLSAASS